MDRNYLKYIDTISKYVYEPKFLYGSRKYGWSTYQVPSEDLEVEFYMNRFPVSDFDFLSMSTPTWLLVARCRFTMPTIDSYNVSKYLLSLPNLYWNGQLIGHTNNWDCKIYVEFVGDISDLKSTYMMLSLSS